MPCTHCWVKSILKELQGTIRALYIHILAWITPHIRPVAKTKKIICSCGRQTKGLVLCLYLGLRL